ncbi:hypothetical protein HU200_029763 [Digitaria exilis]|uniref:Uncharacterized protein n=1 Tax=Digitaria exilis TaxID=1010633 RepID=A0A835BU13_9POAL|nr:hypothetical protein HU200_029763 [Digitaria exilis]
MVPLSTAVRDSYNDYQHQEVTTVGSEVDGSTPAIGFYGPFVTTNEGGKNVGEAAYGTCEHNENIGEAASGSKMPISNPVGNFCWPVVATNDEEENIGKVAYDSILNLESPDPTTLLRIMMGNKFSTDKVSKQFRNVARLQAPEFATLLTVMNNAGYGEAADDGQYDVDKVLTKLEGW